MKFKDINNEVESLMKKQGNYKSNMNIKFDPIELEIGIQVEHEHFKSDILAKQVSLDHLKEDPKYYTKLTSIDSGALNIAKEICKKHNISFEKYKGE